MGVHQGLHAERNGSGRRSPLDFVGIGAARCGTTWIARCLAEHPSIFVPPRKELHYFHNNFLYEPTLRFVRRQMTGAGPDQIRGEFTPRYMINPIAMERIQATCPQVKILIVLRDPVHRAFSEYCYSRLHQKKEFVTSVLEAMEGANHEDYVVKGRFAKHLAAAMEIFSPARMHIMLFEDIASRPRELLHDLFSFLNVNPSFEPSVLRTRINQSDPRRYAARRWWARSVQWLALRRTLPARILGTLGMPMVKRLNTLVDRWPLLRDDTDLPALDEQTERTLYARYFHEEVQETERLLGLDLSTWKR